MPPWVSFVAIFFVTWFVALLAVLPIGVRPQDEPQAGNDVGAPEHPYMLRKATAATVISLIVTVAIWGVLRLELISFRPQ